MAEHSLSELVPEVQSPALTVVNGIPLASSLDVAEKFGKQHRNVLRDIRKIMDNCPESFNALNFELVEYTDSKGEKRTLYSLTRDAFSLVVMGFTGKEALAWKVRYIEAFNAMEKALTEPKPLSLTPFPRIKTLPKSYRDQLNDLVLAKLAHVPPVFVWKTRMSIWAAFNAHFSIPRYNLLPEARMGEALTFLSELEVGPAGTVARRTPQLPLPVDDARRTIAALSSLVEQAQSILAALPAAEEAVQ